jgi:hypothetical protein
MKRSIVVLASAIVAVAITSAGIAQTPGETPYPASKVGIFVAGQTVTQEGALTNFFIQGQTVVFRAYAGQTKTKKLLTPGRVKSFVVQIPNQPNVKLTYRRPAAPGPNGRWRWTGSWTVPADYPLGIVAFRMRLTTRSNKTATFTQIPVATSQLTVTSSVDQSFLQEAEAAAKAVPDRLDVFLYVDTVNGSRPSGAKPRPVGCTQTTTFKRGEQLVFRIWGTEAATGAILSTENVKYAYVKIPGQPFARLNWGAHGAATNRVWFWTAAWNISPDFPLGTTSFRIVFKTESNKFGLYDHVVTITP